MDLIVKATPEDPAVPLSRLQELPERKMLKNMATANTRNITAFATRVAEILGLKELWAETLGDPRICVAVLDGPVDRLHPSLASANLTTLDTLVSGTADQGLATKHGTHVASVLFGQHDGPILGIAPRCRGLIVPIFNDGPDDSLAPASQLDLARAILQAVQGGAHVINISAGESSPSGTVHPILADAVRHCIAQGVLVIAAAGNEGCDCLYVPGGLPSVLAVGAMDSQGEPLPFSNWGERYQVQGILAPGENILGASPDGKIVASSGTSFAASIVSGIGALLLSLQLKQGRQPDPHAVRAALVSSAAGCDDLPATDCRRLLAGRLNLKGAISQTVQRGSIMPDSLEMPESVKEHTTADADSEGTVADTLEASVQAATSENKGSGVSEDPQPRPVEGVVAREAAANPAKGEAVISSHANAPACSCGESRACTCSGGGTSVELVYALGQLGFDFGTEARRDSIAQHMEENPNDPDQLRAHLEQNPWNAEAIIWTLNLDATPIYAIQPRGVFASEGYERLREFLSEQRTDGVERISLPGIISGAATLMSGQVVPVVQPELRCMYSWTTSALVEAVGGGVSAEGTRNFLERVYHELRNLGLTSQDRALNYAATNAFNISGIFASALETKMELDTIEVERSPICRPDSDCWDVKLLFFDPENVLRSRRAHRFTVDVSDICPVMVGRLRSWSER